MAYFASFGAFFEAVPLIGNRLHTLACETSQGTGLSQRFTYEGDNLNGHGTYTWLRQYGGKTGTFTVVNGKLKAFGRTQDMRKPTRMILSCGTRATYSERYILSADGTEVIVRGYDGTERYREPA